MSGRPNHLWDQQTLAAEESQNLGEGLFFSIKKSIIIYNPLAIDPKLLIYLLWELYLVSCYEIYHLAKEINPSRLTVCLCEEGNLRSSLA